LDAWFDQGLNCSVAANWFWMPVAKINACFIEPMLLQSTADPEPFDAWLGRPGGSPANVALKTRLKGLLGDVAQATASAPRKLVWGGP
jgi:hypothetical protein